VGHLRGHIGSSDVSQEHEKLVTSQPPDIVVGSAGGLHTPGYEGEQLVPGIVSAGVVDGLEVVEVDLDDGGRG